MSRGRCLTSVMPPFRTPFPTSDPGKQSVPRELGTLFIFKSCDIKCLQTKATVAAIGWNSGTLGTVGHLGQGGTRRVNAGSTRQVANMALELSGYLCRLQLRIE